MSSASENAPMPYMMPKLTAFAFFRISVVTATRGTPNTAAAVDKLAEILKAKGCPKVAMADLTRDDMAEALEDAFRYGKVVLAAASYNAGVMPAMEDFLHHLKGKNYQNRTVALVENGSWAPTAARTMREILGQTKDITVVEPAVTIRGALKDSDLPALEALADAIL